MKRDYSQESVKIRFDALAETVRALCFLMTDDTETKDELINNICDILSGDPDDRVSHVRYLLDKAIKILCEVYYCIDDYNFPVNTKESIESLLKECFDELNNEKQ